MATVNNPTMINTGDVSKQLRELPIRADETSATRYVQDKGLGTYSSFSSSDVKFTNEGGTAYLYYVSGLTYTDYWLNTGITYEWRTGYGYEPTIDSITYS